jgi:hypothetical protein
MSKAFVAIGGGEIRSRGTAPIDREIIRLTNKKHPRLLFIPTASSDSGRYWKRAQEYSAEKSPREWNFPASVQRKLHSKRPVEKDPLVYYDGCLVSADGSFALTMIPNP